jgi:hypothetical protein
MYPSKLLPYALLALFLTSGLCTSLFLFVLFPLPLSTSPATGVLTVEGVPTDPALELSPESMGETRSKMPAAGD